MEIRVDKSERREIMNIEKGQKCRVFEVRENEHRKNTISANISTFEGKGSDGEKIIYSSWNANFVGAAYDKAKKLKNKDVILLMRAKADNNYDKKKERLYVNVTVFDFELFESSQSRPEDRVDTEKFGIDEGMREVTD